MLDIREFTKICQLVQFWSKVCGSARRFVWRPTCISAHFMN